MIYDEIEHVDYVKCFEQIASSWYIREFSRYLREYLKYCFHCQIYQIKKHIFYDFLQSILTFIVSFYTITMNFILILLKSQQNLNIVITILCKFFKRVTIIVEKITWFVDDWNTTLLNRLNLIDWKLSKIIIFDKNKKFLFDMWNAMFKKLNVKLLYSIVYYFQTNKQNERINQIVEIVIKFHLITTKNSTNWFDVLSKIQRYLNNEIFAITIKSSNETIYKFTSIDSLNLSKFVDKKKFINLNTFIESTRKFFANTLFFVVTRVKVEIVDFIALA